MARLSDLRVEPISPDDEILHPRTAGPGTSSPTTALDHVSRRAAAVARRWIPEALKAPLRRLRGLPIGTWEREATRLRALEPFTRGVSRLLGPEIEFVDPCSFLFTAEELFLRQLYRFVSPTDSPVVLDCGANIGLSILYVKALYPKARITAFEPDPVAFGVLQGNVERFGLVDVELRQEAVWRSNGVARFRQQGGDAGRLAMAGEVSAAIDVRTTRIRDFLEEPVDFLKIDIEGAESEVIEDCAGSLGRVQRMFVEYHSLVNRLQRVDVIFRVLREAGLRTHVEAFAPSPHPFVSRSIRTGMDSLDMALNIWAFRP